MASMVGLGLTPLRILIVDDSAIFRRSLRTLLESRAGWEICGEAFDGAEGVKKNRLLSPQLILMDLSMPLMNGLESSAAILKEFPKALIMLLTLHASQQLAEAARKIGIRATISKTAVHVLAGDIDKVLLGA